jgi:hypothetical protein
MPWNYPFTLSGATGTAEVRAPLPFLHLIRSHAGAAGAACAATRIGFSMHSGTVAIAYSKVCASNEGKVKVIAGIEEKRSITLCRRGYTDCRMP